MDEKFKLEQDEIKQEEVLKKTPEKVKEEIKEQKPQVDPIDLIKKRFNEFLHSQKVLARAVKSCPVPQITEYLAKRLEQEPKWETTWNLVRAILTNQELPKCKFCGKQLYYSAIAQGKQYCSEQCQNTDNNLINSNIQPTGYETIQKTQSFFEKIKNFFKRK